MDDFQAISAITNWKTAKAKRSAHKGKITCLKKRLDEFALTPLKELQSYNLNKLRDDLYKEKKLHEALQYRCEQLLEAKVGITEEQITKEVKTGEESNNLHSDILHQADVLKVTLGHYLWKPKVQPLTHLRQRHPGHPEAANSDWIFQISRVIRCTSISSSPQLWTEQAMIFQTERKLAS